uniref:Uncharacterized protein n=1 Tax=Oryza meridionalis TaxID=40149 RepID=A0A0E0CK50_9ORYZ
MFAVRSGRWNYYDSSSSDDDSPPPSRSRDLRPGETYITIRIVKGKDADADDPAAPLLLPRTPTKSIDDDFVCDDGGDVDDWRQPAIIAYGS